MYGEKVFSKTGEPLCLFVYHRDRFGSLSVRLLYLIDVREERNLLMLG